LPSFFDLGDGSVGFGELKLWELATGKELRSFSGHTGSVASVAFSPNGRFALSGSWDNTLKLWELASLKLTRPGYPA
jgi:WD40 repeat protein